MTSQEFVAQLTELDTLAERKSFLDTNLRLLMDVEFADGVTQRIKEESDHFLRVKMQKASDLIALITYISTLTNNPLHRAFALSTQANVEAIGTANYQLAVELCDESADIYLQHDKVIESARSQIVKIIALARLGDYERALEVGKKISDVFYQNKHWLYLANVTLNIAVIHGRRNADAQALALFEKAGGYYSLLEPKDELRLSWVELNRGIHLRNLGRFEESIQASQTAWDELERLGQYGSTAHAQRGLGSTCFLLGRYNEALKLFEQSRNTSLEDNRRRDALLTDLYISECLLQLGRFTEVLEKAQDILDGFIQLNARWEVATTTLHQAMAYSGLKNYGEAVNSLDAAYDLFAEEGNESWMNLVDLEKATILYHQGEFSESLSASLACAATFQQAGQTLNEANAYLIAARSHLDLKQFSQAETLLQKAITIGTAQDVPHVLYQSYYLLGKVAESRLDLESAVEEYNRSIEQIERLRRRLMVELRVDFQENKQVVYEDIVRLCLELEQPMRGLEYAERAKSRALIDLLAYRLDVTIQSRSPEDVNLIQQLEDLQSERDRLYRRWETEEEYRSDSNRSSAGASREVRQTILQLEKEITNLRDTLLVRNADYAQDISLQQVHTEPIQPYLSTGTVLLEYFVASGKIFVFCVTGETVQCHILPGKLTQIQKIIRRLRLNMQAVPQLSPERSPKSLQNAKHLLQQLYDLLILPIVDNLNNVSQLIIVPHGLLHYLPFHALYDGTHFLTEKYTISYLPGASLLKYIQSSNHDPSGLVAFGYSQEGRLSHTVHEIDSISRYMDAKCFVEKEATLAQLQKSATNCRILHLATHGDFRADNPLFSGLILADSPLTTLKIFNMKLQASLVTLSACQTGRNVVGGGDELLGLMRAFLYAGAASIVLSLWAVEDRSTAQFMKIFYRKLSEGSEKAAALRHTHTQFIHGEVEEIYKHPYFWAPFFLIGDPGKL